VGITYHSSHTTRTALGYLPTTGSPVTSITPSTCAWATSKQSVQYTDHLPPQPPLRYPPAPEAPMQTAKEQAVAMISALPDDVSIEEIHYRLYVLEQVRAGLAELDAGEGIAHEAVEAEFAHWLGD
jgi:predicted transcriptional regulator